MNITIRHDSLSPPRGWPLGALRRRRWPQNKVNLGVSIPAATHSFTGGIVYWANAGQEGAGEGSTRT